MSQPQSSDEITFEKNKKNIEELLVDYHILKARLALLDYYHQRNNYYWNLLMIAIVGGIVLSKWW